MSEGYICIADTSGEVTLVWVTNFGASQIPGRGQRVCQGVSREEKHRTLGEWYRTDGICVLSSKFCHIAEVEEECVGAPAETRFDKQGVFAGQVEMHCGPNTCGV